MVTKWCCECIFYRITFVSALLNMWLQTLFVIMLRLAKWRHQHSTYTILKLRQFSNSLTFYFRILDIQHFVQFKVHCIHNRFNSIDRLQYICKNYVNNQWWVPFNFDLGWRSYLKFAGSRSGPDPTQPSTIVAGTQYFQPVINL